MRRAGGIFLLLLFLFALLVTGRATADSWTWPDRKGGRGPLGIDSVKVGHSSPGGGSPAITIRFDRPLKPGLMGKKDFVVVDIEADGKRSSDVWIYFVAVDGRLETFDYDPRYQQVWPHASTFQRPNPRTIKLYPKTYYRGGIGFAVGSYSKNAAAGCGGGCWDAVPERGYLVHDWTAPAVEELTTPEGWVYEDQFPVSWKATDTGFSRVWRTSVVWREAGTREWRPLATRSAGGRHEATVSAVEGAHMMIQAVAQDRAGNVGRSYGFTLVRVPFDDASEAGNGTFDGVWLEQDDPAAFRGSVHVATAPSATLSFTEEANEYCVVVKWLEAEPAQVRFQVGDGTPWDIRQSPGETSHRFPYCVRTDEIAEQTATFTVLAGRAGVDGYWAGVDGQWSIDGEFQYRSSGHRLVPRAGGRPALTQLQDALPPRR